MAATARLGQSVWDVARYWTSASQEARYALLERAIKGDPAAPPLEVVRFAAILAEVEAGETGEG